MENWVTMVVEAHVDRYITLNFMTSICCNSKVITLVEHFQKGEWNKYNSGIIAKISTLLCLLGKIGDGMGFHVDWSQTSNIGFALHKKWNTRVPLVEWVFISPTKLMEANGWVNETHLSK
jgi:hypothetical protein